MYIFSLEKHNERVQLRGEDGKQARNRSDPLLWLIQSPKTIKSITVKRNAKAWKTDNKWMKHPRVKCAEWEENITENADKHRYTQVNSQILTDTAYASVHIAHFFKPYMAGVPLSITKNVFTLHSNSSTSHMLPEVACKRKHICQNKSEWLFLC